MCQTMRILLCLLLSLSLHPATGQETFSGLFSGDFQTTPSGLRYRILKQGNERRAGDGYSVRLDIEGSVRDGKVFINTFSTGKPRSLITATGQMVAGLDEGIRLIGEGGEILLKVPSSLGYGTKGTRNVPPGSDLLFRLRLLEISPHPVTVFPYPVAGKDTLTTPSGLRYIVVDTGKGPHPRKKEHVTLNYTGYLPEGKVFDSSLLKGKPFTFRLGDPGIIRGWNEGVALMRPGARYRLIIPWKMAYGKKGLPPVIPPKTDLIFDVHLLTITP